jgi:hypothetical protein
MAICRQGLPVWKWTQGLACRPAGRTPLQPGAGRVPQHHGVQHDALCIPASGPRATARIESGLPPPLGTEWLHVLNTCTQWYSEALLPPNFLRVIEAMPPPSSTSNGVPSVSKTILTMLLLAVCRSQPQPKGSRVARTRRSQGSRDTAGKDVPAGMVAVVRSSDSLRAPEKATALATLIRQRRPDKPKGTSNNDVFDA